jgi:Protein of unknown function (DUF2637)
MSDHPTHPVTPAPAEAGRLPRLLALAAVGAGVLVLAAAAFVLSYPGIHAIARQAGVSASLARGYPVIFDAMLVIAFAAVLSLRGAGVVSRCYAWLSLIVLLAAAAGAGALHSARVAIPHRPAAAAAAVIPWALLLIGFGLLLAMLRHARLSRAAAASAPGTGVASTGIAGAAAIGAGPHRPASPPMAALPPGVPQQGQSPSAGAQLPPGYQLPPGTALPLGTAARHGAALPPGTSTQPGDASPGMSQRRGTAPPARSGQAAADPAAVPVLEQPSAPAAETTTGHPVPEPAPVPDQVSAHQVSARQMSAPQVPADRASAEQASPAAQRVSGPASYARNQPNPRRAPGAEPDAGDAGPEHGTADAGPDHGTEDAPETNAAKDGLPWLPGLPQLAHRPVAAERPEPDEQPKPGQSEEAADVRSGHAPPAAFHRMWSSPTPPGDDED